MGNPAPPQPRANERTWILNSIHTWTCSRLVRSFVHSSIPRVHSFVPSFTRSLIHSKLFIKRCSLPDTLPVTEGGRYGSY